MFKVKAFNDKGKSSAEAGSNEIGVCSIRFNFGYSSFSVYVLKGAGVADCIKAFFNSDLLDRYYIEDGYYYYKNGDDTEKIIAFMQKDLTEYNSIAEIRANSYLIPPEEYISDAVVTKDMKVYSVMESQICPSDSDLHTWEDIEVIKKATLFDTMDDNCMGIVRIVCSKCGAESEYYISPVGSFTFSKASYPYTGKAIKPAVTVKDMEGRKLKAGMDYTVAYSNNVKLGTAKAVVTLGGQYYEGRQELSFQIVKAANPLKIKGKTAKIRYSRLKKKTQTLKVAQVIRFVKKVSDKKTYKFSSAKKGKKSFKKYFKVNAKTGKVTVKKGLKKGTYKVKVKVKALGNKNYKASKTKTVTFTVKVK